MVGALLSLVIERGVRLGKKPGKPAPCCRQYADSSPSFRYQLPMPAVRPHPDVNSLRYFRTLLFIGAAWLATMSNLIGADTQMPSGVKWVNPQLPAGPGLEHHVLHSAAVGWDVG